MKFTTAAPVLAILPAAALGATIEKRDVSCETVWGGQAGKRAPTNTQTIKGRFVERTVRTKSTVYLNPTVTRTLTGSTTATVLVTRTRTGRTSTVTITGSSTSTVATQPGFIPAAAALPTNNSKHAAAHKYFHAKDKREATPEAEAEAEAVAAPVPQQKKTTNKKPANKAASKRYPLRVQCVRRQTDRSGPVRTITKTEAIRPFATHYNAAKTINVDRRSTKKVERVVATTTFIPKTTLELPRATHYAACAENNLLGYTWGASSGSGFGSNGTLGGNSTASARVGINSVKLSSGQYARSVETSTAAACCIRCQQVNGCVGSQWRSNRCTLLLRPASAGSCSHNHGAAFTVGSFFANEDDELDVDEGLIVSNGKCAATWKYGGE